MKKWKQELKKIYNAPKPESKDEFLQSLAIPGISLPQFLLIQLKYIRKLNWFFNILFFIAILIIVKDKNNEIIVSLSALLPLLALSTVSESHRSMRYGMAELELSCRFSLRLVVMSRLAILGVGNLVLLGITFPILCWWNNLSIVYLGVYLFVPYLFTCFCSLLVLRKFQGKEGFYCSCGITVLVSALYVIFELTPVQIYYLFTPVGWLAAIGMLALFIGRECFMISKQSEEYIWSW